MYVCTLYNKTFNKHAELTQKFEIWMKFNIWIKGKMLSKVVKYVCMVVNIFSVDM